MAAISTFKSIYALLGMTPEEIERAEAADKTLLAPKDADRIVAAEKRKDWNPVLLRKALSVIPSDHAGIWFKIGAALFSGSQGSDEGFELWDEWSQTTTRGNYDPGSQRKQWAYFHRNGTKARVSTVFWLAKQSRPRGIAWGTEGEG